MLPHPRLHGRPPVDKAAVRGAADYFFLAASAFAAAFLRLKRAFHA
ncbi:hypothetical protein STIAU_6797 [Stigmatella aurantiaca DW4/3-1]|uniref:Uncharacterized protein n=1 Tax=Stigmatella aurantiaca (strain DW4/3-1) TaxID=378806 RepID=Q08XB0_STIAD|nr:hypothetical protein STIAU_6797 [Stigmatella aurantiaca DW4/3-1]